MVLEHDVVVVAGVEHPAVVVVEQSGAIVVVGPHESSTHTDDAAHSSVAKL